MTTSEVSVYSVKYAESELPESMVFLGGSSVKQIPISFAVYLIETKDKKILVDAGCNTMPGFIMKKYYSPAFAIRTVDVMADEITDVIISHSHHDHIEAIKYFNNAIIHISKSEYESGKKYIPDNFKISIFEDVFKISSQIRIVEMGGHSKGSSIVEITVGDVVYVLAGDECYTNANIERKFCTGACFNKSKSMYFVEKYSDSKYLVYTCHDISLKTERII